MEAEMTDLDLCYLSATEALKLFSQRKLSPVELIEALIERADRVEPSVNAFTFKYFDEAMAAARKAEERYMKGEARPLEGIPTAIKDESEIEGLPMSNASFLLKDYVAESTSFTVQRLLDAGVIVHARTATPEFSIAGVTWSDMWGVTRNPWSMEYTCGGSSGGSAASLAAGTTTLANGSDIGGSIRIPASFCGVVGYKPPYGRNPESPPFNLEYYNHSGPLARNLADCILLQNTMSGPHPADIASLKTKLTIPTQFDPIQGWRIAFSIDLGYMPIDPQVRENTLGALEVFRGLGAEVLEVELDWPPACGKAALDHLGYAMMGCYLREFYEKGADQMMSYARSFAEYAEKVTWKEFVEAEMLAGEMYSSLRRVFAEHDLFICPTIASDGLPADFDPTADEILVDGVGVEPTLGWAMTYPFNMLSRCPALSAPSGRASNGVPTGIQLVGPAYEDLSVFRAAVAYERAAGPFCSAGAHPAI
jgi:Asp-tRNA(Asn)/Glu-tRNA(Gln) amidotransferase A subunit family amidase